MLSHKILVRQHLGKVAHYYEESSDDYYTKDGQAHRWLGKGAEQLGLTGAIESKYFRQLLTGHIKTNRLQTRKATRHDAKTRIGIDLTFSAPKSVSLQALVAEDERILEAHDRAVHAALTVAEKQAETRKKIKGKSYVEATNNLIIACFRHETNREHDPQLHTHAVVMNLTQRKDGAFRALKNDKLIKMTRYLGALYRAELAFNVQQLGYQLRLERHGFFELAHIDASQLENFSQRSQSIEAEIPFAQLQQAGMATAHLHTIQRQKNEILKKAVYYAAQGQSDDSLQCIPPIQEIHQDQKRMEAIARDYLALSPQEREQTLIISGTNQARKTINHWVRQGLFRPDEKSTVVETLVAQDRTQAEKTLATQYEVGDQLQLTRTLDKTTLNPEQTYRVMAIRNPHQLILHDEQGNTHNLDLTTQKYLNVYRTEKLALCIGDKVRITRNDPHLTLTNGDRFTVFAIEPTHLTLKNDERAVQLPLSKPLYLDYAYATTIHSSQGLTCQRVLIDLPTKHLTTFKDTYYVAISRAQQEVRIYTDHQEKLPQAIAREAKKYAALEMTIHPSKAEKEK